MDGELAPTLFSVLPLLARGRLRAAAGDNVRARADLEDALRRIQLSRGLFPWAVDAWVALVPVLRALGDDEAARAVADQALTAATAAASRRRIGGALRSAAWSRRVSQAWSCCAKRQTLWPRRPLCSGARKLMSTWRRPAPRRTGRQRAPDLRDGLNLAHRCGATPLADRAADELRAAGGRPRRRAATGADALTASERRVAELAASERESPRPRDQ